MNYNRTEPRLQNHTCGVRETPMAHFTDVDRALNRHLMKTDPRFLRDSENARRMAAERRERKNQKKKQA